MNRRNFLKFMGTAVVAGLAGKLAVPDNKIKAQVINPMPTPTIPADEKPIETPQPQGADIKLDIRDIQVPTATPAPKVETSTTEEVPEFTPTPESGKFREIKDLIVETDAGYDKPFNYENVNETMKDLGLNLGDLISPKQEKIKDFDAILTSNVILPIFTPTVDRWSGVVARKCFEYNLEHPDNMINPNTVLAIISLETQGNSDAVSGAGAVGLMQLTSWVYGGGFFGSFTRQQMFDPELNIEVGIAYLGDLMAKAKSLGFENLEALQYAVMEYNGGPKNASRFFKTKQAVVANGADSAIFDIDSDSKIATFLRKFYGNAKEYYTYGTNLVKKETLYYKENLTRFGVMAEISKQLSAKGYSDGEIRMLLSQSTLFKSLASLIYKKKKEIAERDGAVSYFEFKDIVDQAVSRDLDLNTIQRVEKDTAKNPANLMMDVVYSQY
jgi:hypothetical protein